MDDTGDLIGFVLGILVGFWMALLILFFTGNTYKDGEIAVHMGRPVYHLVTNSTNSTSSWEKK